MSRKERKRLTIMVGVQRQELTLVQAAELMGVSYRQSKRIWRRYQAAGRRGPGASVAGPAQRAAQARRPAGAGAGALRGGTLRGLWPDADGRAPGRRKGWWWITRRCGAGGWPAASGRCGGGEQKHRQWRERKPCFGAMVQLDGSHHDWFEGRGAQCVLDGDGGRRDQPDAGAVLRGGDHAGQLRCVGRLGAAAWVAGQPVCGSGQHLPLRRGGRASPSNWRARSRRRSLGGRWSGWGWN